MIPIFVGIAYNWSKFFGDWLTIVGIIVFSLSNGFFSSLAMIEGPASVDAQEKQTAGLMMSFFLQAGLLAGSQAAFGFSGPP